MTHTTSMTDRNIVLDKAVLHTKSRYIKLKKAVYRRRERSAMDVAAEAGKSAVHISGAKADFLKGKGAGHMHPTTENALNTDTPTPAIQPKDERPAASAAAAAESTAGQAGTQPNPAKDKAGKTGKGPRHAKRKAGRAAAEQNNLPDGQDAKITNAAAAAEEKIPQNADPPEAPDSGRQDEAERSVSQGRPDTGQEERPAPPETPDTGQAEQADAQAKDAQAADEESVKKLLANAPTLEQLEKELKKERLRIDFSRVLRNTIFSLIVVAAVSALIAVLFLPVLQIHGSSMSPTFTEQDIVAAFSVGGCRQGDLIAFYYNNNILVKRVIAGPGDWVDMDEEGNVSVNGQPLEEPYLTEKARGNCDITFPYQVPDARYFVMGDQRATSVDSRSELVGCISREMIIGRIFIRVWPLDTIRLF